MYKLVILGSGGVGKSSLTIQFVNNYFTLEYNPTIETSFRKQVSLQEESVLLEILDTAGQEEYSGLREQHIAHGQGFLLVYAVDSLQTFESINELYEDILRSKDKKSYPVVVCANKFDMPPKDHAVTSEQTKKLIASWNNPYSAFFETSAKNRMNVSEAFIEIVTLIRKYESQNGLTPTVPPLKSSSKPKKLCVLV